MEIMDKKIIENVMRSAKKGDVVTIGTEMGVTYCGTVQGTRRISLLMEDDSYYEMAVCLLDRETVLKFDSDHITYLSCHSADEANTIVGKDEFEKYGIDCGLSDSNFMSTLVEKWDDLDSEAKEEITDTIACSLDGKIVQDFLTGYVFLDKQLKKENEKVSKLLDERIKDADERIRLLEEKEDLEKKYGELAESITDAMSSTMLAMKLFNAIGSLKSDK